jgi:hypothetical protein
MMFNTGIVVWILHTAIALKLQAALYPISYLVEPGLIVVSGACLLATIGAAFLYPP